ncbi:ABC transporter permease [Conexibacter woesei]|uniref:Binding-protein-dependent transport systems inner membrane component n=1 Tax=Conexibacter woesei (strain DSM 14684 / CCUG 47730 / CIP 108061 / JCM 11494 / NBRC 100937 / ID131577) TaxID=469383 RepID=D3F8D3_CONWI|nr:ABC transporter permease [Conexibacter woesei]ADB49003.1 binding-protein-dependent transport systems inner membrane component [Conexibacter woesei DSM 14684]
MASSGRRIPWLVLPALALLALGVVYPVGISVWRSFAEQDGGQSGYAWMLGNDVYVTILLRTFATALLTTLVCLLVAYPYAYLMTVAGPKARIVLLGVALLPFWISALVRTFAWLVLLQPGGVVATIVPFGLGDDLLGSWWAVEIGIAQVLLPFMVLPLYATMRGIDRGLLRAAESLGARPSVAFLRVFVPLSLPGVFAGCLFVFILTLGFYVVPALLGSPSQALIGQTIYTQVNELLAWGRGGALAVVLLVATFLVLGLVAAARRFLPGAVVRRG